MGRAVAIITRGTTQFQGRVLHWPCACFVPLACAQHPAYLPHCGLRPGTPLLKFTHCAPGVLSAGDTPSLWVGQQVATYTISSYINYHSTKNPPCQLKKAPVFGAFCCFTGGTSPAPFLNMPAPFPLWRYQSAPWGQTAAHCNRRWCWRLALS